jgi:hypothetical protein
VLSFPDNPLQMTPNEEFTDPSGGFGAGKTWDCTRAGTFCAGIRHWEFRRRIYR